jgi:4-diphosphocytidyl-2-C-methyl-D-erythritol kinase
MQKIDLVDRLTLRKIDRGISLHCTQGKNGVVKAERVPEDETNLAYRAAGAFFSEAGFEGGVEIFLEKNIPVAAGLGGGSSDAAAVIRGLNSLFPGAVSRERLLKIAGNLGADIPFFLDESPAAFACGIGDVLHPIKSLTGCCIVLVNPGFPVSTKWVYDNFALTSGDNPYTLGAGFSPKDLDCCLDMAADLAGHAVQQFFNDLERVTQEKYSEIGQCKQQLLKDCAEVALMSGSGPTIFGIFSDLQKARESFAGFKKKYSDVFFCRSFAFTSF